MSVPPSQRQLDLLAVEDPRFHAIGPGGTGLLMIATSERRSKLSKKVVSFALPSAPALYLSLAHDARSKRMAIDLCDVFVDHPQPQGTWPENHRPLFDWLQLGAAEIIFSFTALEAFANESIPASFEYTWTTSKKQIKILKGSEIERSVQLDEKLKHVLPKAHNIKSPSGTTAWQQFKELKHVRDRLVHLKTIDRKASGPEHQTIWGLMIAEQKTDFVAYSYNVIGAFPELVKGRRWFELMGETVKSASSKKRN